MAEGFKISEGYVKITADYEAAIAAAGPAGEKAGNEFGGHAGETGGRTGGEKFASAFGRHTRSGLSSSLSAFDDALGNMGRGLGTKLAVYAGIGFAPFIGPALSGAFAGGAGLGVIGLGAWLLRENPAVQAAGNSLMATLKSTFTNAAQPLVQPIANALGILKTTTVELGPQLKEMFAAAAPAVEPLAKGLAEFAKEAMPGFLDLVKAGTPLLTSMATALPGLGEGLSKFMEGLSKGGPGAQTFFTDLMGFASWWLGNAGTFLGWLSIGYDVVRKFLDAFKAISPIDDLIQKVLKIIGPLGMFGPIGLVVAGSIFGIKTAFEFLSGAVSTAWNWIKNLGTYLGGVFMGALSAVTNWIKTAFTSAVNGIVTAFNAVVDFFQALPGKILSFLMALPGMIGSFFMTVLNAALYAIGFGLGLVYLLFTEAPGKIMSFLASLPGMILGWMTALGQLILDGLNAIVQFFVNLWQDIKNLVMNGVTAVVKFFSELPGKAASAISTLWTNMQTWFVNAVNGARDKATELVNGAINFIRELPGKAANALSGIKDAILGAFSGAGGWLTDAAGDMVRGFARGLETAMKWAIDAARKAASKIVDGFKDALKIGSPSKIMEEEVGAWVLPGVGVGMEKSLPKLRKDMGAMVGSLTDSARSEGGPGFVASGSSGVTYIFHEGAITIDASKLRSIDDLLRMIADLQSTARQYSSRGIPVGAI